MEFDGNPSKKPVKRPAAEDLPDSANKKLKLPAKKQKPGKKTSATSVGAEVPLGVKQTTPTKRLPSMKLQPKRRVLKFLHVLIFMYKDINSKMADVCPACAAPCPAAPQ